MKMQELLEDRRESLQNARDYIAYARDGYSSGTSFRIENDYVAIYQETDESEEEGEEGDTYYVSKSDLPPALWREFLEVAKSGQQW